MAKLYNFCTYNATKGGRYQSTAWDVCCDQWQDRPEGNPSDWACGSEEIAEWYCGGVNPQTWTERAQTDIDWSIGDDTNPQTWSCHFEVPIDWSCGDTSNPQDWQPDIHDPVPWLCGDTSNPQVWDCADAEGVGWGDRTPPEPVVYEPILKDDRVGLDCGS